MIKIIKDERLINWLKNRGVETQEQLRSFLNPTYFDILNPFELMGITQACKEIKNGIKNNKKFVIVGDYDCDGIMASTLVYQYLISENAQVSVFIPNRFEDGYGLNKELIDEILISANPDILITVDLGISCNDEIDYLKEKGVTVIVTDHHEPQEVIPDCIVIDPKIKQDYACSFLCGTGVAFKLISALAGKEFSNKFLDIVAIATIGDIVPLLNENRVLASLGLERLNKKQFSLNSLKYMFNELKIEKVNGSDIYLKIVPKINASGRMDNAKKVFDFLNATDENIMRKLLAEILADNNLRLDEIGKSLEEIQKQIESINVLKMPIICIKGDFHQGILGILASRIMAEYNKPSIIFAKTDNGTYKASGRSVEGLDLHGIIGKYAYLCEHFGGHKMAIGLEIKVERFDEFVSLISNETINALNNLKQINLSKNDYIIIKETDINADFISQLNLLAPFGCDNEKPLFSLNVNAPINVERLGAKDSPHLKLNLGGGSNIVYFYGLQHKNLLLSPAKKQLILDIDFNYFKNKAIPQAIVKNINILEPIGLEFVEQFDCMNAFYLSKSILNGINNNNIEKKLLNLKDDLIKLNEFGTLIFACTNSSFETLKGLKLDVKITDQIPANKQTAIIINSYLPFDTNTLIGYKNLVFLDDYYKNQFDFLTKYKVFTYGKITNRFKVEDERYKCGLIFSILKSGKLDNKFTNIVDLCLKIKNLLPFLKANEICICLLALEELEIISINNLDNLILKINETSGKKNLENSKILNYFRG